MLTEKEIMFLMNFLSMYFRGEKIEVNSTRLQRFLSGCLLDEDLSDREIQNLLERIVNTDVKVKHLLIEIEGRIYVASLGDNCELIIEVSDSPVKELGAKSKTSLHNPTELGRLVPLEDDFKI